MPHPRDFLNGLRGNGVGDFRNLIWGTPRVPRLVYSRGGSTGEIPCGGPVLVDYAVEVDADGKIRSAAAVLLESGLDVRDLASDAIGVGPDCQSDPVGELGRHVQDLRSGSAHVDRHLGLAALLDATDRAAKSVSIDLAAPQVGLQLDQERPEYAEA